MKKVFGILMVIGMLALVFASAPAANAACGDPPAASVNWNNCDKSGQDLTGATLSNGAFLSTNFTGATLTGATMAGSQFGSSGANPPTNFTNAKIDGLDLSTAFIFNVNFTGATGTPDITNAFFFGITCPDGSTNQSSCSWLPAAVTLGETNAAASPALWPLALAGLLLLGTIGTLLARRDARVTAVA